jgi:SAM-dependent methyltransferase
MTDAMQIHWDLFERFYSNEHLLKEFDDPFAYYAVTQDLGLLDIGCGQSEFVLKYAQTGIRVSAIDMEGFQLAALQRRLDVLPIPNSTEVHLIEGAFPKTGPPNPPYGLAVVCQVLHFMTKDEQLACVDSLTNLLESGALVYVKAHSKNHVAANGIDKRLKWFFSISEMLQLFDAGRYDCLFAKEEPSTRTKHDVAFIKEWKRLVGVADNATPQQIESEIESYLNLGPITSVSCLFRLRCSN